MRYQRLSLDPRGVNVAIITLTQYKTWAGISGTSDDSRLQEILDAAHAELRRYCGRSLTNGFETATRTEDYDVDASELQVKEWPVTSLTSVTPILSDNTLGSALESTEYHIDLTTGVISYNNAQNGRVFYDSFNDTETIAGWGWRPNFGRVRVVYVNEAAAADIRMALYRMVDTMYASVQRGNNVQSESLGQYSVTYVSAADALQSVTSMLNKYRSGASV